MYKLILTNLMLFFLLIIFSCSQEQGRRFSPEEQIKDLKEKLELTEEQTEKVKTIIEEQSKEMAELRENFEGERFEMRDAMMEIRDETNQEIDLILTDEQQKEYEKIREERRGQRRNRR